MSLPLVVRMAAYVYQRVEMTRLARILQLQVVQGYRARSHGVRDMSARTAVQLVRAVDDAGVQCHLVGGWGVDAFIGRQTRLHDDLDLAYESVPGAGAALESVLARQGYRRVSMHEVPHGLFSVWILLSDDHGRSVDILPIAPFDRGAPIEMPAGAEHFALPSVASRAFVSGHIGRRSTCTVVSCLGPELQLASRGTYERRRSDAHDVALLLLHQARSSGRRLPPGSRTLLRHWFCR